MQEELKTLVKNQFVNIQGGNIELKDEKSNNKWKVAINPLSISKHPVTQDLYFAVTNSSPSLFKGAHLPVENVSWYDAINFCNLLSQNMGINKYYKISDDGQPITCNEESDGYRLPTDAEWEYACRADSNEVRYGKLDKISWNNNNSNGKTHEVGKKQPNTWGLYDMIGNVWEWCWDLFNEKFYGSYRIFRGGGFADTDRSLRASCRRKSHPTYKIDDLGFRIVKSQLKGNKNIQ